MTTKSTTIHWVRHGEVHNPQQILYGRLPRFRLSTTGQRQAERAGRRFHDTPIAAVFSSPMLRARQTAQWMFGRQQDAKTRISVMLNEVYTCFEGQPGADVDARKGDVYTGAAACYEQPRDILARARKFMARIHRHFAGRQVVAVTHGDIITFMVLWVQGFDLTPENKNRLIQAGYPVSYPDHASVTTMTYPVVASQAQSQIHYWQTGISGTI